MCQDIENMSPIVDKFNIVSKWIDYTESALHTFETNRVPHLPCEAMSPAKCMSSHSVVACSMHLTQHTSRDKKKHVQKWTQTSARPVGSFPPEMLDLPAKNVARILFCGVYKPKSHTDIGHRVFNVHQNLGIGCSFSTDETPSLKWDIQDDSWNHNPYVAASAMECNTRYENVRTLKFCKA